MDAQVMGGRWAEGWVGGWMSGWVLGRVGRWLDEWVGAGANEGEGVGKDVRVAGVGCPATRARTVMALGGPEPQAASCSGGRAAAQQRGSPGWGAAAHPPPSNAGAGEGANTGKMPPSRGLGLRACRWGLELLTAPGSRAHPCPSAGCLPNVPEGHGAGPEDFLLAPSPPSPRMPRKHRRRSGDQGPSGLCGGFWSWSWLRCGPGSRGVTLRASPARLRGRSVCLVHFSGTWGSGPAVSRKRLGPAAGRAVCSGGAGGARPARGASAGGRAGLAPRPDDISRARSTPGKEGGRFWRRAAGGQAPRVCPRQALGSQRGTPCPGPWPCLPGDSSRKEERPGLGVERSRRRGPALPAPCRPGYACPCVQACDGRGQSRPAGDAVSLCYLTRGGQGRRRGRQLSARLPGHVGPLLPASRAAPPPRAVTPCGVRRGASLLRSRCVPRPCASPERRTLSLLSVPAAPSVPGVCWALLKCQVREWVGCAGRRPASWCPGHGRGSTCLGGI